MYVNIITYYSMSFVVDTRLCMCMFKNIQSKKLIFLNVFISHKSIIY